MAFKQPQRDKGYLGEEPKKITRDFEMIGDRVERVHTVLVHKFRISDSEDPDLYAAQPLWEWQESEIGKWVMTHAVETPTWHRQAHNYLLWGHEYAITARLMGKDYTYWMLKYDKPLDNTN
jgi:hypothetical protein